MNENLGKKTKLSLSSGKSTFTMAFTAAIVNYMTAINYTIYAMKPNSRSRIKFGTRRKAKLIQPTRNLNPRMYAK